jgi:hypothetical protein
MKPYPGDFGAAIREEAVREILAEGYAEYGDQEFDDRTETLRFKRAVNRRVRQKLIGERDSEALHDMLNWYCQEEE